MEPASPKNNFHYNKNLKRFASRNRKKMTKPAVLLWRDILRAHQFKNYKFRRERPILNFIADFVCFELMLVIEVDGSTHESDEQQRKDKKRDEILNKIGFAVLRITNGEIKYHPDLVMDILHKTVIEQEDKLGIIRSGF